jgi:hypothetical protein
VKISRTASLSTALVLALGLASGTAFAQSATAALSGQAKAGDVAVVENVDTGFSREVKVKDNGRYALRNLPTGTFKVTIRHPDGSIETPRVVTLRVGSTARVQ